MGKFYFSGPGTLNFLDGLLPRAVGKMTVGQALYMPLLNDEGGFVDDIIHYRLPDKGAEHERFYMIVNASNIEKDFNWIKDRTPEKTLFINQSDEKGLIALQGPASPQILNKAINEDFSTLAYYHFSEWDGLAPKGQSPSHKIHTEGMITRTGYTGEDGFEIMVDQKTLPTLWTAIFDAGQAYGLRPAGFGARDTLRLEAGMPLYGHDMNDETTPLEAGLSWAVDLNKENFVGRAPLEKQKQEGPKRRLVGFEMIDRGIPRQDYEIRKANRSIGKVTSGTFSPTFKKNIGMGYVSTEESQPGNEVEIVIRDKGLKAQVVKLPFYKRKK